MHETVPTETSDPTQKKRLRIGLLIGIVSAILLIAAAVTTLLVMNSANERRAESEALEEFRSSQLATEAGRCIIQDKHFDILDEGDAIRFERATKYGGATGKDVFCFLKKIGAPETALVKIEQTRALDGTRTDSWDGFEATWTYHPDSGLSLLVERTSDPVLPKD